MQRLALSVVLLALAAAEAPAQALMHRFAGNPGDGFGRGPSAVRGAGDFDGDGYTDIVVGAPEAGYVEILSGQDGSSLMTQNGVNADDQFGYSVAFAGDVDADGFCDVIGGAPGNANLAGSAQVYVSGQAAWFSFDYQNSNANEDLLFNMHEPDNGFGRAVDTCFDFVLEGADFVVVGADKTDKNGPEAGSVSVWSFDSTVPGMRIRHVYFGSEMNLRYGYSVAGLRDANADGQSDFVVASFFGSPTDVHSGNALFTLELAASLDTTGSINSVLDELTALYSVSADSVVGVNVRSAGDFDNDESEDFILGGVLTQSGETSGARVYAGSDGAILSRLPGNQSEFFEGSSVTGVGDSDHDGYDDVVVASFITQQTRVFQGRTGKDFLGYKGETLANGFEDGFGFAVGSAGDVNADGVPDWCLSTTADTVHVYSGASFFLLGDTLEGDISSADDADEVMLKSLEGARLKITMNGVTGGLKPKIAIFDTRGDKLATLKFQANANGQKRKFDIPATGYYRLVVTGRDGTTGSYSIDTGASKFKGKNVELTGKADGGEFSGLIRFDLDALCGATLTAKIKPLGGFPSIPTALLLSPFGLPIPIVSHVQVKNGSLRIKDVPLIDGFGTHEFWVYGGTSTSAEVFYKIKTKQPFGTDTLDINLEPPF